MRANRRLWRWAISVSLPLVLKVGLGCAQVAGIYPATAKCQNGRHDDGEEKIDCGGVCIGACPDESCSVNGDCASGHCVKAKCVPPTCQDKILNGTELEVDTCREGTACNSDTKQCAALPPESKCDDDMKNGTETDVDCGGEDEGCRRCSPGKACKEEKDCSSRQCMDGTCRCEPCGTFIMRSDQTNKDLLCDIEVYDIFRACACVEGGNCAMVCANCADLNTLECQACITKSDAESGCKTAYDNCNNNMQ